MISRFKVIQCLLLTGGSVFDEYIHLSKKDDKLEENEHLKEKVEKYKSKAITDTERIVKEFNIVSA